MKEVWIVEDKKTNEIEGIYITQDIAYKNLRYIQHKTGRDFRLYKRPVWES